MLFNVALMAQMDNQRSKAVVTEFLSSVKPRKEMGNHMSSYELEIRGFTSALKLSPQSYLSHLSFVNLLFPGLEALLVEEWFI